MEKERIGYVEEGVEGGERDSIACRRRSDLSFEVGSKKAFASEKISVQVFITDVESAHLVFPPIRNASTHLL